MLTESIRRRGCWLTKLTASSVDELVSVQTLKKADASTWLFRKRCELQGPEKFSHWCHLQRQKRSAQPFEEAPDSDTMSRTEVSEVDWRLPLLGSNKGRACSAAVGAKEPPLRWRSFRQQCCWGVSGMLSVTETPARRTVLQAQRSRRNCKNLGGWTTSCSHQRNGRWVTTPSCTWRQPGPSPQVRLGHRAPQCVGWTRALAIISTGALKAMRTFICGVTRCHC